MPTAPSTGDHPFAFQRWRAKWIWGPASAGAAEDGERWLCFRRSFTAAATSPAVVRVTADARYVLWVNGVEASRGPVRSQPNRLRYDTADIAPLLSVGENVLAVTARFYGRATPWWMPAPRTFSLGAGSLLLEARVGQSWIVTDDSWLVADTGAWTPQQPRGIGASSSEVHNGTRLSPAWRTVGFDDTSWVPATVLDGAHLGSDGRQHPPNAPFGALLPRPLPPLTGDERPGALVDTRAGTGGPACSDPVDQVQADEDATAAAGGDDGDDGDDGNGDEPVTLLTFDFGGVVAGTARLAADLPAGTQLDVSFAETLRSDGRLRRLQQRAGFRYTTRGGGEHFETFDPLGARFARVTVRPPLDLHPSTAEPVRLAVQERLRPRPAGPFFTCSDPSLNAIYEIGRRTVDLCAQDAYLDCPTREQRAWTGDAVVHQQVDLASNPDWSLARHHPVLTASPRSDGMLPMVAGGNFEADQSNYLTDWPLHWIRSAHNLMRWTGDADLVASLLATAENQLRWFVPYQGADGLLTDVTGWVLIDWSDVQVRGTSGALNALWARALVDFAAMADWLGDHGRSAWAANRHREVADGFEQLWDPGRGVYVDHIVDGAARPAVSQHTNAAAIAGALVPHHRISGVLDTILDRRRLVRRSSFMEALEAEDTSIIAEVMVNGLGPPTWDTATQVLEAQPFFRYVVHDAVAGAGQADRIADLCRDWTVFVDAGETSWPESWHGGTHCHGWSSTPTRDLVVYTIGISPATPGFGEVRIAPRLGDLSWVRGAAPTPHGMVEVAVDADSVEITSPVPVLLQLRDGSEPLRLPAGHHVHPVHALHVDSWDMGSAPG